MQKEALRAFDAACGNSKYEKAPEKKKSFMDKVKEKFED